MGKAIYILGESGRGKSYSMRNLNPEEAFIIQVVQKDLYRSDDGSIKPSNWQKYNSEDKTGSRFVTDDYATIIAALNTAQALGRKIIIIDDIQYVMANEFMRRAQEKGFEKFTELAKHMWEVITHITATMDDDIRVYMMSHIETIDGQSKVKTIGKLLDEKICLEGLSTIVLGAECDTKKNYWFETQNNGRNTLKSPPGMFEDKEPNDLKVLDKKITEYYGI